MNVEKIAINRFKISCFLGESEVERASKQNILVDIELFLDMSQAGNSDLIEHTVNYKSILESAMKSATKAPVRLLERMAYIIIDGLIRDFQIINTIKIRVWKEISPLALVDRIYIEVEKCREH